ncbi:purine-binding chemotaxis protein CheW [Halorubrum alkaliphilum]|uniref:Purine-binding chemotaxis protein CheW n=1 Tax=Halorubrum alkaliphilum TaxID=261290 RepID=A0A8T4GF98_9EURY|nr:chemotaxis protein CheW [Halorubrum alkaliphilum]MBP1922803.1 purine-binding chemotaxis protein CheW [Halorubrum alkaliphilum]
MAAMEADAEPTKVLEFGLGEGTYCLDIGVIDEIVDAGELTRIPNSPDHVEGVMDLRGRTTTIVDPKTLFGIGETGPRERIVVFDDDELSEGGTVGWIVDEVFQVRDVSPENVDDGTTADDPGLNGIVKSDDRFVVWVDPEVDADEGAGTGIDGAGAGDGAGIDDDGTGVDDDGTGVDGSESA